MNPDSREFSSMEGFENPVSVRERLTANLHGEGMFALGFLSRDSFLEELEEAGLSAEAMRKYDIGKVRSVVVAALRYGEGDYPMPPWVGGRERRTWHTPEPMLRIARFARANWYAELSGRLLSAVRTTIAGAAGEGTALPAARQWHRLVNSGLPEKSLARKAGLGWIGKNGIMIAAGGGRRGDSAPACSSAVVLGLLLCPVDLGPEAHAPVGDLCGECGSCVEACPTRALLGSAQKGRAPGAQAPGGDASAAEHGYDRLRCIQHWTAIDGDLPPSVLTAWDGRLYGCDSCLEACPFFRTDPEAETGLGRLGPALPAGYFMGNGDDRIRRDLKGSALGRAWMSLGGFRRSARLAFDAGRNSAAGENRRTGAKREG